MASAADQRETDVGRDSSRRRELVGVGVILVRGEESRSGCAAAPTAAAPGRSPAATSTMGAEACALRELGEETGLRAQSIRAASARASLRAKGFRP
jgi:8-oxo-dGTP pyrophosphatase MutT (NUDIX family)